MYRATALFRTALEETIVSYLTRYAGNQLLWLYGMGLTPESRPEWLIATPPATKIYHCLSKKYQKIVRGLVVEAAP